MSKINRLLIENIKNKFDYDLYKKYLSGEVKRFELCEKLKCTDYALGLVLNELNLKTRYDYIYDNTLHDFFDIIDSEEKAYIIGLYLADGTMDENGRISFGQTKNDSELVYIVKQYICPVSKICTTKESNGKNGYISKPMCYITFLSHHMCDTLNGYGIGLRKTYNCKTDLSFIKKEQMIHFIRGYFDGDGTVCLTRGKTKRGTNYENVTVRITSYKSDHLYIISKFLLDEYNINTKIYKETRGNYVLCVNSKPDFIKFRNVLYKDATLFLKRKKDKMLNIEFNFKPLQKKILVTNIKTNEEKIYPTLSSVGKEFGVSSTSIRNWIKLNKTINYFKFYYA